jgi:predicted AlkP superfamily phosphohydrolase/phosphomutase
MTHDAPARRVLAIGLDGFEPSVADRLIAAGRLPALARLCTQSASWELDHGPARRTGLAWEHVATGLSPAGADRWSSVDFEPSDYGAWILGATRPPFTCGLGLRTVIFDAPYFDLTADPDGRGLVSWGAHDPGIDPFSNPPDLKAEIDRRFGDYPATPWIYGFAWPSADRTAAMGTALAAGVDRRAEVAEWLFTTRFPEWDLALVVVSELHSAAEGLWHGIDPDHPLHGHPSAGPAGQGVEAVYERTDALIARLAAAVPDATLAVFSMHGMGPNNSDVPGMVLLPELLYRHGTGRAKLRTSPWPVGEGPPTLEPDASWLGTMGRLYKREGLRARWRRPRHARPTGARPLHWMPPTRYQADWPALDAFALPSFYDGRVRVNLQGREAAGRVAPVDHHAALDEVELLLRECRDPATGASAVASVERADDPAAVNRTDADLVVMWAGAPLALEHDRLGTIGPIPYRRTGGHTGGPGVLYLAGGPTAAGHHGVTSAFDVVPTLIALTGRPVPPLLSGTSLVDGQEPADTTPADTTPADTASSRPAATAALRSAGPHTDGGATR